LKSARLRVFPFVSGKVKFGAGFPTSISARLKPAVAASSPQVISNVFIMLFFLPYGYKN
jgi:hypothetical protein